MIVRPLPMPCVFYGSLPRLTAGRSNRAIKPSRTHDDRTMDTRRVQSTHVERTMCARSSYVFDWSQVGCVCCVLCAQRTSIVRSSYVFPAFSAHKTQRTQADRTVTKKRRISCDQPLNRRSDLTLNYPLSRTYFPLLSIGIYVLKFTVLWVASRGRVCVGVGGGTLFDSGLMRW